DFGRHTAAKVFKKDRPAKSTGYDQRTCGQDLGPDVAERPLAEARHDSRQQRQEYDYQDGVHVLALHPVDVIDRDGASAAEVDDQNGQPDRRLAGSDGQDEHGEDLPRQVAEEGAEGDEVDVHRKQDQLNRHQDDDDVLTIKKDAEHAEHEQDRADNDIVFDPDHSCTPCPTSGRVLTVASSGRRAICRPMFWCARGARLPRCVSTMAPTMATSRIRPAASNRNRYSVKSSAPMFSMLLSPTIGAAVPSGVPSSSAPAR